MNESFVVITLTKTKLNISVFLENATLDLTHDIQYFTSTGERRQFLLMFLELTFSHYDVFLFSS